MESVNQFVRTYERLVRDLLRQNGGAVAIKLMLNSGDYFAVPVLGLSELRRVGITLEKLKNDQAWRLTDHNQSSINELLKEVLIRVSEEIKENSDSAIDAKREQAKSTLGSVFLSHSSKDKFFVRELAKRFQNAGVKVWLDEAELNIGDSLTDRISKAIDETQFFGIILSTNSISSSWVQRELRLALEKELSGNIVILPILLDPVQIPAFLRDKIYVDLTTPEKFEQEFPKLLKALGVKEGAKPAEVISEADAGKNKILPIIKETSTSHRLAQFEDIKITGLDESKSHKLDPLKALYNIYLQLSDAPAQEWQEIFEAKRHFPRHTMWRRAWIEGQYIVINCVPEELEAYHLNDLKEDVHNSNEDYRNYLTNLARKEAADMNKERKEVSDLMAVKNRLKFD